MSSRTWSRRKPDAGSFARAAAHRAATSAMASASLVGIVLPWLVRIRSVCEANGLRKSAQFDRIVRKSAQVNTCWRMECCQALRPIESADQNLVCLLAGGSTKAPWGRARCKRSGQKFRARDQARALPPSTGLVRGRAAPQASKVCRMMCPRRVGAPAFDLPDGRGMLSHHTGQEALWRRDGASHDAGLRTAVIRLPEPRQNSEMRRMPATISAAPPSRDAPARTRFMPTQPK